MDPEQPLVPYLVVVQQNEPSLYSYLKWHMEEPGEVAVILDRRFGERRRRSEPVAGGFRRGDRRGFINPREILGMPDMGFQIFPAQGPLPLFA